jgi:hypothetical protein
MRGLGDRRAKEKSRAIQDGSCEVPQARVTRKQSQTIELGASRGTTP